MPTACSYWHLATFSYMANTVCCVVKSIYLAPLCWSFTFMSVNGYILITTKYLGVQWRKAAVREGLALGPYTMIMWTLEPSTVVFKLSITLHEFWTFKSVISVLLTGKPYRTRLNSLNTSNWKSKRTRLNWLNTSNWKSKGNCFCGCDCFHPHVYWQ